MAFASLVNTWKVINHHTFKEELSLTLYGNVDFSVNGSFYGFSFPERNRGHYIKKELTGVHCLPCPHLENDKSPRMELEWPFLNSSSSSIERERCLHPTFCPVVSWSLCIHTIQKLTWATSQLGQGYFRDCLTWLLVKELVVVVIQFFGPKWMYKSSFHYLCNVYTSDIGACMQAQQSQKANNIYV